MADIILSGLNQLKVEECSVSGKTVFRVFRKMHLNPGVYACWIRQIYWQLINIFVKLKTPNHNTSPPQRPQLLGEYQKKIKKNKPCKQNNKG